MVRGEPGAAVSVERFFQLSLLGMMASGFLAIAGSGFLDTPTIVFVSAGLLLRGMLIVGLVRLPFPRHTFALLAGGFTAFYLLDYYFLSRALVPATERLAFFLAVLRILTARAGRVHLDTAAIAFVELVWAAILSINLNFFLFLALFLMFAMAALTSGEIRRSMRRAQFTARGGARRFHLRLATLTTFITAGILMLTAGFFFLLPRTADAAFSRLVSHRMHLPGFSSQVSLGEIGELKTSSRPVMHISFFSTESPGGLKWRGGTLIDFDGKRWSNPNAFVHPVLVDNGQADLQTSPFRPPGRGIEYQVFYDDLDTSLLFFAGTPQKVYLPRPTLLRTEGTAFRLEHLPFENVHYEAYSILEEPPETSLPHYPTPVLPLAVREQYLQLPPVDPRIPRLAVEVASGAAMDLQRARAIEHFLRSSFAYTLELPSHEVADPLAYFLFTRRKGHCEYFASAMAVMLRTLGIPARLATGFQSGVYNPFTELWVVRASDAHTWVEAWIPSHGWTTFDPTPPDPHPAGFAFLAGLSLYLDAAQTFWRQWVVAYDSGQQGSLLDRLEQGARHMGIRWSDSLSGFRSDWKQHASA